MHRHHFIITIFPLCQTFCLANAFFICAYHIFVVEYSFSHQVCGASSGVVNLCAKQVDVMPPLCSHAADGTLRQLFWGELLKGLDESRLLYCISFGKNVNISIIQNFSGHKYYIFSMCSTPVPFVFRTGFALYQRSHFHKGSVAETLPLFRDVFANCKALVYSRTDLTVTPETPQRVSPPAPITGAGGLSLF